MSLFGRRVHVDIGQPGQAGVRLQDLRIAFDVAHGLGKAPSTAKVSIWGVRPETIAEAQRPGAIVRIAAGYTDSLRDIFVGKPVKDGARLTREAPERVLSLELSDGGVEIATARTSAAWSTEVDGRIVFDQLAADLGVSRGVDLVDPSTLRFPTRALMGPTAQVLDEVCRLSNAAWAVRDGALIFFPREGSTGEVAPVYSVANRTLIGTPTRKDGGLVEFTVLLDSAMRPGKAFQAASAQISGDFVAQEVAFRGDSGFDTPFYAVLTAKARPIPNRPPTAAEIRAAAAAAAAQAQARLLAAQGGA